MPLGGSEKTSSSAWGASKPRTVRGLEGALPDLLYIHMCAGPRPMTGHFPTTGNGKLIKSAANRSSEGVQDERSLCLVMMIKLKAATAASALEGFMAKLRCVAEPMC